MAKTQQSSTVSPYLYSTGNRIYAEDGRLVSRMLNYAAAQNPTVHFSFYCGPGGTGRLGTFSIEFGLVAAGWEKKFETRTWIDPDIANVEVGAVCSFTGTDTGEVRFTVGGGSATLSFATSDTGEKTATIATSVTGTGQQTVTIEVRRTLGSATANLSWVRLEDTVQTTLADNVEPPPNNIIERYTWDASYWGSEAGATSWPEHGGTTAWDLTRTTGSAPTTGVSTSGLAAAGLPGSLVNNAVTPAAGNSGFHTNGATVGWSVTDNFHVRMIVFDRTTGTSEFFFRHLVSGTHYATIRGNSATSLRFESRNTTPYIATATPIASAATNYYLIDWYCDVDAGGGNTLSTVWINGTAFTFSAHSASEIPSGSGTFGILGAQNGTNSPAVDLLFWGVRFDIPTPFLGAQHNGDAIRVGLNGVGP